MILTIYLTSRMLNFVLQLIQTLWILCAATPIIKMLGLHMDCPPNYKMTEKYFGSYCRKKPMELTNSHINVQAQYVNIQAQHRNKQVQQAQTTDTWLMMVFTPLSLDKMATISQLAFSHAFSSMNSFVSQFNFHSVLLLRAHLTISYHCFQ